MLRAIVSSLIGISFVCVQLTGETPAGELGKHVVLLRVSPADSPGYALTETNATSITRSSLVTSGNYQFAAYYDSVRPTVDIARRALECDTWEKFKTDFAANNLADSHDAISMGIDGKGFLHLSWGMHSERLKYAKSLGIVTGRPPFKPQFGPVQAIFPGQDVNTNTFARVTYPEFYNVPGSDDLLLTYRFGSSGKGNQYMSRYDAANNSWAALQPPGTALISGEGVPAVNGGADVNAYPNNLVFDARETLYLSWTWRTGGDTQTRALTLSGFQTNYNMLFAKSTDAGKTWQRNNGTAYKLPITQATSGPSAGEIIAEIAEGGSLINTASMAVDAHGRPMIATWWAPGNTTDPATTNDTRQYMLLYYDGQQWQTSQITKRQREWIIDVTHVPEMAQPLVMVDRDNRVIVVMRQDREHRGDGGISVAYTVDREKWEHLDLSTAPLGDLEPTFDWALWKRENKLAILYQPVAPVWNGIAAVAQDSAPINVLIWDARAHFRDDMANDVLKDVHNR